MFHKGLEDGKKSERFGESSQDCISNQSKNGIIADQN
jgi:hypothetical protein